MPYEKPFNTLRFLKEYEKFPCLWKKKHPDFRNREERELAEKILLPGSELKSITDLKKKIRSLRGTYNFERSKVLKSRTPEAPEGTYKPKLVWYDIADRFLRDNEDANESDSSSPATASSDSFQETTAEKHVSSPLRETPHPSIPATTPSLPPPHHGKPPQHQQPHQPNRKRQRRFDEDENGHASNGNDSPQAKNEFTTFGQHVASQLQALPLADAVSLQAEIQCLITSTRLRLITKASIPQPEYPRGPANNPPVDMNGYMLPSNVAEGMHANQCFNYNASY